MVDGRLQRRSQCVHFLYNIFSLNSNVHENKIENRMEIIFKSVKKRCKVSEKLHRRCVFN